MVVNKDLLESQSTTPDLHRLREERLAAIPILNELKDAVSAGDNKRMRALVDEHVKSAEGPAILLKVLEWTGRVDVQMYIAEKLSKLEAPPEHFVDHLRELAAHTEYTAIARQAGVLLADMGAPGVEQVRPLVDRGRRLALNLSHAHRGQNLDNN